MNNIFIMTAYDRITGGLLSSLLNLHPEINCKMSYSDDFFPDFMDGAMDSFIEQYKNHDTPYHGLGLDITAFIVNHQAITNKISDLFKLINITLSPIQRIRFIMHQWLFLGIPPNELAVMVEESFMNHCKTDPVFVFYKINHTYIELTKTIFAFAEKIKQNITVQNQEGLEHIDSAYGRLFRIALVMVLCFDTTDSTIPIKNIAFENVLQSENELRNLITYLTRSDITFPLNFSEQYKKKLEEINFKFNMMINIPWFQWQDDLLRIMLNILAPTSGQSCQPGKATVI